MSTSLFAPSPRRKRGLILTLSGSLLFHGSLVGVAAFWPTRPAPDPKPVITDFIPFGPESTNPPPQIPASLPSEPEPAPPVLKTSDPVGEPPPVVDPSLDDMTLATPAPHPAVQTPTRNTSPSAPRTPHTQIGAPVGTRTTATAIGSGIGLPGVSGHWNKPKPAYPAALRLAHVQGSGVVRVTTDAAGRVISAVIVQSTGNALLDDNTCRAARNDWSGPPNSTLSVPITYQLQ